jgi:hypothetical protein
MRKFILVLAAAALGLVLRDLSGRGGEPKSDEDKLRALMHKKLENSQKVLEGITTQDFKMISSHAEELIAISKEAGWKVVKTPRYEAYSNDFRREAEDLIKAAKDKNVDAAALAYVDLTLTCVKCHKHVREERMTSLGN